jgi:hypothetical protein
MVEKRALRGLGPNGIRFSSTIVSTSRSPLRPTARTSVRTICRRLTRDSCWVGAIAASVKTVQQAKAAPLGLLNYVAIGGVYGTTSKDNTAPPMGIARLRAIVNAIRVRNRTIRSAPLPASMPATLPI